MRTSERTMLASMAFADADRAPERRSLHDQAVMFLAQDEQARALATIGGVDDVCLVKTAQEHVVKRGTGFVVGFADLVVWAKPWSYVDDLSVQVDGRWLDCSGPKPRIQPVRSFEAYGDTNSSGTYSLEHRLVVEVKVEVDDPGAVARQVKLYADSLAAKPIVAACRKMTHETVSILRGAGVVTVQLGRKFDEFLRSTIAHEADGEL